MRKALLALLWFAAPLPAQTSDWARVTVGLAAGSRSGTTLWDVTDQPLLSSNHTGDNSSPYFPPDLVQLHRDVGIGLTVSAQGTFYSSPHFGITFEMTYLGLKLRDNCTVTQNGGDPELATACALVGSSQKFGQGTGTEGLHDASAVDHSATAMLIQGGIILRPFRPAALQPFVKLMAGFATTPHSTVYMESIYGVDPADASAPLSLTIYQDYTPPSVRPTVTAGFGITTQPNSGLQLHIELRGSMLPQATVTGPTLSQGLQPLSRSVLKTYISLLAGLDLVLKRDRGKRY